MRAVALIRKATRKANKGACTLHNAPLMDVAIDSLLNTYIFHATIRTNRNQIAALSSIERTLNWVVDRLMPHLSSISPCAGSAAAVTLPKAAPVQPQQLEAQQTPKAALVKKAKAAEPERPKVLSGAWFLEGVIRRFGCFQGA